MSENLNKKYLAGFSLLEVPIALGIIAVMLLIYGAASNSVMLNRNSRDQDLAVRIAASELEDLRKLGYAALPLSGGFSHSLLQNLPEASANFTVSDYNSDTKQVTVAVIWKEPGVAASHKVFLTTLINKHGL